MSEGPQPANYLKHFLAGTIAGVSQLLVGHPFDTIKVRGSAFIGVLIQSTYIHQSWRQDHKRLVSQLMKTAVFHPADNICRSHLLGISRGNPQRRLLYAMQTFRNEGIRGLYRGMGLPLTTVAAFNAVLFSTRGTTNDALQRYHGPPLQLGDHLVSSMVAGVVVSFLASPTELVKCRLQHQGTYECAKLRWAEWEKQGRQGPPPTLYRGPADVLKDVFRNEGGLRGCFNGLAATLWREIFGNLLMFGSYEGTKHLLAQWQGIPVDQLGTTPLLIAGGIGGTAFWVVMFPIDVIKSKLQIQRKGFETYGGILDCYKQVKAAEGLSGFYRGYAPCLLRAFPANAVAFLAYENAIHTLNHFVSA